MLDGLVNSHYDTNVCHSRESGNLSFQILTSSWIPAFAGMTTIYGTSRLDGLEKTPKQIICHLERRERS